MSISTLRISGSALSAERLRLDVISQNIANVQTTRTSDGRAYQRREVVFEEVPLVSSLRQAPAGYAPEVGGGGVRATAVVASIAPTVRVHNAGHPDADAEGYVEMPNVNLVEEMVDMVVATRAYEANVAAAQATKTLVARALELGRA